MKTLKASLFVLLCSVGAATFAQSRSTLLCKDSPVPDGFVIAGETITDSCRGTAWIIKPKPGARPMVEKSGSPVINRASFAEPNETIAPGQCDAFQQEIARTYNFNPARMSEAQIKAQSEKLDSFWNEVRAGRATLLPCLRKALREETSGSFLILTAVCFS